MGSACKAVLLPIAAASVSEDITETHDTPPRLAVAHLLFTKKSSAAASRTRRASVDVAGSRYGWRAISTSTMRICMHGHVSFPNNLL